MSRKFKKLMATLCAIALVVASLAGYEASNVKADAAITANGKTFTVGEVTGNYVGFVVQGAFDNIRFGFAWSGDSNAASPNAEVTVKNSSGSVVKNFGSLGNGSSIFVNGTTPDISDLASGTYTIEFKGTGNFASQLTKVPLTVSGGSQTATTVNPGEVYDDDFDGDVMTNPWFELYTTQKPTEAPTEDSNYNKLEDGKWTAGVNGWNAYAGSWGQAAASINKAGNNFVFKVDQANKVEWSLQAYKEVAGLEAGVEYVYELTLSSTKAVNIGTKEDITGTELIRKDIPAGQSVVYQGTFTPTGNTAKIFAELGLGAVAGAEITFGDLKITKKNQPTTAQVTTQKQTTAQVTTQKQTTAQVTTQKQTTAQVTTQKQTTAQVTTQKQTTAQVTTQRQTTAQVTTQKQTTAQVTTQRQTTQQVTTQKATEVQTSIQDLYPGKPSGLVVTNGVLIWTGANNATEYEVYIDNNKAVETIATYFTLPKLPAGHHTLSVRSSNTYGKSAFESIGYDVAEEITTQKQTTAQVTTQAQTTQQVTTQEVTTKSEYVALEDNAWNNKGNWSIYAGYWAGAGAKASVKEGGQTLSLKLDEINGALWSVQARNVVSGLESGKEYKYEVLVNSSKDITVQSKEENSDSELIAKELKAGVTDTLTGTFTSKGDAASVLLELGSGGKTDAVVNVISVRVVEVVKDIEPNTQEVTTEQVTTQEVTTQEVTSQEATSEVATQVVTTKNTTPVVTNPTVAKAKVKKATKKKAAKKIKITLKKIANATGYQVQISKAKKFKKKKILVKKNIKKLKLVKKAVFTIKHKKIKNKKKLWVRARAYVLANGKLVYGKWSKAKKAKVK